MTRWQRFRWWLRRKPRTKEQATRHIRRHFAEMGIPLDHLNDEELEQRVIASSKRMLAAHKASCVTVAEMGEAMKRAAQTLPRFP